MSLIGNFPARFAFTNPDGTLTMEALKLMREWFNRIGGANGITTEDLDILAQFTPQTTKQPDNLDWLPVTVPQQNIEFQEPSLIATVAELAKTVADLKLQIEALESNTAEVAKVKNFCQELDISYSFAMAKNAYVDWEHPGRIGYATANSGAFTTISATGQITSTLVTGTAPLVIASTTNVANLNASSLSGATFAAPGAIGGGTPGTGAFTTLSTTGQFTSTLAVGTAPFVITSTTNVANLNASTLGGATFAAPGAIGGTTASTGAFTSVTATGAVALASGQKLYLDGVAASGNTYLIETSGDVLDAFAGGTKTLSLATTGATVVGTMACDGGAWFGSAALATTATTGHFYIPTCTAAPTGVPATKTGQVALQFNTTSERLCVYTGGAWKTTIAAFV